MEFTSILGQAEPLKFVCMLRSDDPDHSTVLLVDDDAGVRDVCSRYLRKAGFAVEVAANGREAQVFFREKPASIQLLITDIEMPFVSGPELADFAAACGNCCPVLLISGKLPPDDTARRGWEFLPKPFSQRIFMDAVQRLLTRRERPKALVAEDDTEVRNRLCELLSEEYDVVAALPGGSAVLEKTEQLHPDVILLDISMPDTSGLAVMRALREKALRIPVVFVTQHTGQAYVGAALDCGASGYVTKARMFTDLRNVLREVRSGRTYFPAELRTR